MIVIKNKMHENKNLTEIGKHTIKVWVTYKASMEVKDKGLKLTNIKITVKGFIK